MRHTATDVSTAVGTDFDHPWVRGEEKFGKMEEGHHDEDDEARDHDDAAEELQGLFEDDVPGHQPSDDDVEEFVPTEAEKDAAQRARAQRLPSAAKSVKRPRSPPPQDDVPDLAEIFDNYDTPYLVRISICRAYASYIASLQPKRPKASRKK